MIHALWIFCRIVSAIWLLGVFYTYAWHAYRLAKTDRLFTGVAAFATTIVALLNVMNWHL